MRPLSVMHFFFSDVWVRVESEPMTAVLLDHKEPKECEGAGFTMLLWPPAEGVLKCHKNSLIATICH